MWCGRNTNYARGIERDPQSIAGQWAPRYPTVEGRDPTLAPGHLKHQADSVSDRQLHDLFEVARVDVRSRKPGSDKPPASIDEWVSAFKHKRTEISLAHCPA